MPSIKKKGDSLSQLKLQPGWVIENDGFGLLTSRLNFVCDADQAESLAPKKSVAHPKNAKLFCYKSSYVINDNDIAVITSEYIGLASSTVTDFQVTGEVALASQPIQTHPKFATGKAGGAEKPLKDLGWDSAQQAFPEGDANAIKYGLVGVKSYYAPDIQITGTFYTSNEAVVDSVQKMVGKTFTTIPNQSTFKIPAIGVSVTSYHDKFCLVTGMTYETFANIHKVRLTFRVASGGWNNLIYEKSN